MKNKKRHLDWLATALFFGVAAMALASFTGGSARADGWICPDEFDHLVKLTGYGFDLATDPEACKSATRNLSIKCGQEGGGKDCCDMAPCSVSCVFDEHLLCAATRDGWPWVYDLSIDGGDGGSGSGGGGNGSGD